MEKLPLLITFMSVLIGLALTNLLHSLHLLLRNRKKVKWHWLPMVWVFLSFESFVLLWFNVQIELDTYLTDTAAGFLLFITPTIFHLMFAIAILPDDPPEQGFDFLKWFLGQSRYIFSLCTVFLVLITFNRSITGLLDTTGYVISGITIALAMSLAVSKNFYLHAIVAISTVILVNVRPLNPGL